MNQDKERQRLAVGLTGILGVSYLLISIIEALAWANFANEWWGKIGFAAWAGVLVWSRAFFSQIRVIAEAEGNHRLASTAGNFLLGGVIITLFSMMSLYADAIHNYVENQKKNAAPVLMAQANLEKARLAEQQIRESVGFDDGAIAAAVSKNAALKTQLQAAEERAAASHLQQVNAVKKELTDFWNTRSFNHEHVNSAVMDENCTPLRTNYGVMKANAAQLCPRLKAIQAKMPDLSSDPDVARIRADMATESPKVSAHQNIEAAKAVTAEAEEAFHLAQQNTGVASGDKVYPPIFHDLHDLMRGAMKINDIAMVFGFAAIFLVLMSPHIFQQGLALVTNKPVNLAREVMDMIPGGRIAQEKLAQVVKPHAPDDNRTGHNGIPAEADTGAKVLSDGWMVVHKGNHILNEGAVRLAEARGIDLNDLNRRGLEHSYQQPVPSAPSTVIPASTNVPVEPESDMGRVSKTGTNVPEPVKRARTNVVRTNQARRADNDTKGMNANRYRYYRQLVLKGDESVRNADGTVSIKSLQKAKYAGIGMGYPIAVKYYSAMKAEGIVS